MRLTCSAPQAIVFVQVLCFAAHRNSVETHSLGAWASAAAFVNTITTWLQIYDLSDAKSFRHDVAFTLLIIAGVAGGCLTIAAISIPRRPRVQYNGERVDNEFGSTLLSRYTWSWGWELIQLGSKKGDLDQKDIPRPAAYARAARLVESWNSLTYEGTLLWRILRAYSFEMAFQYGLALLKVTLSLAPFALMETLLHILESQSYEERTLRTLAPLVIGMGIVSLMQQVCRLPTEATSANANLSLVARRFTQLVHHYWSLDPHFCPTFHSRVRKVPSTKECQDC